MYLNNKKYVFLITIDSLRADKVGYIGESNLTPNIDNIAKDSIQFLKAFANGPGTNQSFPAIMTSTYFLMHKSFHLLPNTKTLAMVLKQNEFKTVAFHSNPFLSKTFGWHLGFDEFYDFLENIKSPSSFITKQQGIGFKKKILRYFSRSILFENSYITQFLKKIYYKYSGLEIPYLEANILVNNVINWIKKNKNSMLFIWMHFMDPHFPYIPPKQYLKHFSTRKEAFNFNISKNLLHLSHEDLTILKDLYEGEVKYVDSCIGKFIEYLTKVGYIENSLILIMSDHGEAFMEHNKFGHNPDIMYNEVI
ncbi:MAG: sulfatase, partial [Candidatus Hodarchaeota archaeon]